MNKKSIFTSIIWIILFSLVFSYSLVFAGTWIFDNTTKIVFKSSNNIYLDSFELKNTQIIFKSWKDLSNYKIKSKCEIFSKLKYNKWDYYMFDLRVFNNICTDKNFILVDENNEINIRFKLNFFTEYKILSQILDYNTARLVQFKNKLDKKIKTYSKYEKYNKNIEKNYYTFLKNNRLLSEFKYNKALINNIIEKRSEKYLVPIIGKNMPVIWNKIPNTWRWYRSDYTDGIHHGWDIDWDFWEQVVALDDWIIIKVVSNFNYSNLNAIKRWNNITNYDRTRNLDILRWNQIWLKTMSWDIVMYSHLNDVFSNIKVWEIIKKQQPIWTIWITGVPDKNYKDYHLHFVVHTNPFNSKKAWKYDLDDYMEWDWMFKWKNKEHILKNQWEYFEGFWL